ncbi:MAG: MFS transporter [Betaproteobacteria bacterium]|nr:MFS transporter [Betaproteobacteria bacterium]
MGREAGGRSGRWQAGGKGRAVADRALIYAAAFLRALANGLLGVLLGLYLARLDYGAGEIGLVISLGLAGAAAAALVVSLWADRLGRRRILIVLAVAGALGGAAAALVSGLAAMAAVAFFGMLNGMGRDRGAALVLEQALLPATAGDAERTRTIAWYHVLQDVGHAAGGLLAVLPDALQIGGVEPLASFRASVMVYAALLALGIPLYVRLSPALTAPAPAFKVRLAPESRKILWKISGLFAVDSIAGGFFGAALLAYFFSVHFGASATAIALLFLGARAANAVSHLGAAWLAKRIGLVNTMVFTHIPSSLLLMTIPFAPDFATAAVVFLVREGLVEMDVPTRQSYLMAVVRPEERTFASGVTHLVRVGGWAVAPTVAGALMQFVAFASPIFIGAAMKIGYDVMLYAAFRNLRPPEEQKAGR